MILISVVIAVSAVAGLFLEGDQAFLAGFVAIGAGAWVVMMGSLLDRAALSARLRGREGSARVLSLLAWLAAPTARRRLASKVDGVVLRALKGGEIQSALRTLSEWQRLPHLLQLRNVEWGLARVMAARGGWARLASLYDPVQMGAFAAPPSAIGRMVVEALCREGQGNEAAELVEAMEAFEGGGGEQTDAWHDQARMWLLAAGGRQGAIDELLVSPLRPLFTKEARGAMADLARRGDPVASVAGWARPRIEPALLDRVTSALRVSAQLGNGLTNLYAPARWTATLMLANLAVFVFSELTGSTLDVTHLLRLGAATRPFVLEGEAWRLLGSTWLHTWYVHLLFNVGALLWAGTLVERLVGGWRFGGIYLGSGLVGALAHIAFQPSSAVVGASGAVFGLIGAALVLVRTRHDLPERWRKRSVV